MRESFPQSAPAQYYYDFRSAASGRIFRRIEAESGGLRKVSYYAVSLLRRAFRNRRGFQLQQRDQHDEQMVSG